MVSKIIRKKLEEPERNITLANYQVQITDLIGVRALHLFKHQWRPIYDFIEGKWTRHEQPVAYYRKGDDEEVLKHYKTAGCNVQEHGFNYRSIHHVIKTSPTKEETFAEIQVRTIFEEGWSEIDHTVRYPCHSDDPILNQLLMVFNRLAGSADEMGTFVAALADHLRQQSDAITRIQVEASAREEDRNSAFERLNTDLNIAFERLNVATEERDNILRQFHALQQSSHATGWVSVNGPAGSVLNSQAYHRRADNLIAVANSAMMVAPTNSIVFSTVTCPCGEQFVPWMSGSPNKCPKCNTTVVVITSHIPK